MSTDLAQHAWWLASRASGIVALVLVTISVGLGLTMAGRWARKPGLPRVLTAIHEQTAVTALAAIAVHGVTLLGDPWLNPGPTGIALPFTMAYRPLWTGLGIVAGYLGALLGLSFYIRRRIGPRLWRQAHRLTVVVYALAVAHTLGAGTDASTPWMRIWLFATAPVIAVLFVARLVGARRKGRSAKRVEQPAPRRHARAPRHHPRPDLQVGAQPAISEEPA
jgi:methionine sulfoxide reductase heme-binding subunit